ncbi:MAG: ion transporter [Oscillospiraceae bacterium]|nr:ion transporter [Oscillospiraceae bacterium]
MGSIYKKIKAGVFNLIRDDDENDLVAQIFDGAIIALIVINVVLVILDTFSGMPARATAVFHVIETASVAVFSAEYVARIWASDLARPGLGAARARLRYVLSFSAVIDLIAILPFYLPFIFPFDLRVIRMMRLLRLLRILKVNRYTSAMSSIGAVFRKRSAQLLSSVTVVMLLALIASVLMYSVEHEAQPGVFKNAFSGLWWAVATLTTVGYGDIFPITVLGKFFGATIALLGVGLVAVPTGIISAGFMEQVSAGEGDKKEYCPHCGKKLD